MGMAKQRYKKELELRGSCDQHPERGCPYGHPQGSWVTLNSPHEVLLQSAGCGDRRTEVRMSPRKTAEAVSHTRLYPLKGKERV